MEVFILFSRCNQGVPGVIHSPMLPLRIQPILPKGLSLLTAGAGRGSSGEAGGQRHSVSDLSCIPELHLENSTSEGTY